MEARTIWHNKERSWSEAITLGDLSVEKVLIKSTYSLVSQGTERTMITHKLPVEIAQNMTVPYMQGCFSDKFTYGYSLVGEVIEGKNSQKGKLVHLMHPHQDYAVADVSNVFEIPLDMDPKVATLASNLETAVNALWDSEIEAGDHVLIAGYGLIGALLAVIIQKMPGVSYEIKESDPKRKSLLRAHGHTDMMDDQNSDSYDIVFNTTGNESVLKEALKRTVFEGKIIEMSWFGASSVNLELGADFHYGRKRIISSQVSHIPLRKRGKWDFQKRKQLVFQLLSELDFSHLTGNVISFEDAPAFFEKLRNGSPNEISTIIKY
ncbi:MAG: zinc-binding alcohol dehydrogenase [Bacteroidota bacterium]